jgi:predicted nucleic acid-binding Zn ribbon protein
MNPESHKDAAKNALNRAKRRGVSGSKPQHKKNIKKNKKYEDFQDLKSAIDNLLDSHNWQAHTKIATLMDKWTNLIGEETAQHIKIKNYDDETKELLLSADSHSWAVQIRTLANTIEQKIKAEIGEDFVTRVKVVGPAKSTQKHQWRAPSMNKFYDQF